MTLSPLHEGWTLSGAGHKPVPAQVPGCVHLDLLADGLIPDPYLDDNEEGLKWIGQTEWVYETRFRWTDGGEEHVDLECEGLDTIATIRLNGIEVAQTANMHRRYRFPVRHLLKVGENHLSITFASVYSYTANQDPRPAAYGEPYNLVRKMACNFGWDWGPTLVTAGIWRPIGLRSWSGARLGDVRPLTTVHKGMGVVEIHAEIEGDAPVTASIAGHTVLGHPPLRIEIPDVELWWPRGFGDQPLYDLDVSVPGQTWRKRVGFRNVRLDTTPDDHGTPYTMVVNDVPVFVRGVNWIPDDCFPSRITRERLAQRLTQACEANVNYLRVWGGGRYESEEFYELADEMGLLVGQDFLFACAAYPEEEPLASEVLAEARDNVTRLSPHPSLVLWTGNNECLWGHEDWGWPDQLQGKTWGSGYYFETLPGVLAELDPTRPYWPGSPYSGFTEGSADLHPNDPAHGNMHIWDVWNSLDYTHYRSYTPRFVAEYGFQAPPTFATLAKGEHQKAIDGELKLQRGLDAHLPQAKSRDDWHYFTQVNQARAISLGVEHFRSLQPLCMGSIVWQLNDCWPVTSWSAIDGDGRLKPMWYALRAAYADRLLTIQPEGRLVAVNDSAHAWQTELTVSRLGLDGDPLAKTTFRMDIAPRSKDVFALPREVWTPNDERAELVVVQAEETRAFWFFAEDKDISYPRAGFHSQVEHLPSGYRVTVTADTILRDLTLFADRLDPASTVDRALVTVLPGESATFEIHTDQILDPAALVSRPVLRCINDSL